MPTRLWAPGRWRAGGLLLLLCLAGFGASAQDANAGAYFRQLLFQYPDDSARADTHFHKLLQHYHQEPDKRIVPLAINYLNPESPESILSELRALLLRAAVTTREVSLLRGMARQIRWAGDRIALTRTGNDNRSAPGGAQD